MTRAVAVGSLAVIALLAHVNPATAQAWVPPARTGSVTFVAQTIDHVGRLLDDGSHLTCCATTNVGLDVEVDYALTDRWSISFGFPYVLAKYRGEDYSQEVPFLPFAAADACRCLHGAFQDVGFTARYNLININRAFMVTPSVSIGVPSHSYEYVGEAVIGFGLKDAEFAVDAGQRLDAIARGLSVQGRYAYTVVQQPLGIAHNRSNGSIEGDFAFTRRLAARGILSWQRTQGGLRFPLPPQIGGPDDEISGFPDRIREFHRLLRDNYVQVGGGLSYAWHQWDLSASYLTAVRGTNSHEVHVVTVSLGWQFEIGGGR